VTQPAHGIVTRGCHPALSLIGAPYLRGGHSRVEGFDCFTLLEYVRREYYNRVTPVHASAVMGSMFPPALACARGIYRTLATDRGWHPLQERTQGCAVALGRFHIGRLHHVGVVVGNGVLHAAAGIGVCWLPGDRVAEVYARVEYFEWQA
jgi:hypothetical protein